MRLRVGAVDDPDVYPIILHGRIQKFLELRPQPVNLVDEQHVPRSERGEQAHEVTGLLEDRADVVRTWTSISLAIRMAKVVFPRPGGPKNNV